MADILTGIAEVDFDFNENLIDIIDNVYEFLFFQYSSSSGTKSKDFVTLTEISTLLTRLTTVNKENMTDLKVYDPTCGSSSLLLKFAKRNTS